MLRLLSVTLLGLAFTSHAAPSAKELYHSSLPAVLRITATSASGDQFTGTAFFLQGAGLVTAFHVVDGAVSVEAHNSEDKKILVTGLLAHDKKLDLAILGTTGDAGGGLTQAVEAPTIGERMFVIGCPHGLDFSFSDGILSQTRKISGVDVIQFSAPASPGSSGAPVLDENGRVVGLVSWQLAKGQNLNFAVSIAELTKLGARELTPWSNVLDSSRSSAEAPAFRNFNRKFYEIQALTRIPVPTFQMRPEYPLGLRTNGVSGEATIEFIIDEAGNVADAHPVRASHEGFARAATYAVLHWRFKAGSKGRVPVPVRMQVPIIFSMQ